MTSGGRRALGSTMQRGAQVTITLDGEPIIAYKGESVAAALLAERRVTLRHTPRGEPRGVFCAMGSCFDCLVVIDGRPNTRACMTWVRDGMEVQRQHGLGPI